MIKDLTGAALEGELDSQFGQEISANRRNGKSQKTIKSLNGNFELRTPRDRDGTFSPQMEKKHKHHTSLNDEIEQKIITMYGVGLSYHDISGHLRGIYGLEVSTGTLSAVTDRIIHLVKEWQGRPLASIYPILWLTLVSTFFKLPHEARGRDLANYRPAEGESFTDLADRVWPKFVDIMNEHAGNIAFMGHTGVNRVLLCRILGMPLSHLFRLRQDHACINTLRWQKNAFELTLLNFTPESGAALFTPR